MTPQRDLLTIRFKNMTPSPMTVVLEPWAEESVLPAGASCDIIEQGGATHDLIEIHVEPSRTTFFAREASIMKLRML